MRAFIEDPRVLAALQNPARLVVLRALGLLDGPPDPAFDRITQFAARLLNAPISLISLVDAERQYFTSQVGLAEPWRSWRQTPLSHSFCQHVVADRAPFVVADARQHPRVADSLAIPDLGVIAYAGVPLITQEGEVLGALCVIDQQPRDWSAAEVAQLVDLAAGVMSEIGRGQAEHAQQQARVLHHRAEAQLTAVLAHVPEAVWFVDPAHRITTYNPSGAALFASLLGDALPPGTPLVDLCPPEEYLTWAGRYDRALAGEAFTVEDTVILDGTRHWFELSFSPVQRDSAVEGVTVIARDITVRRAEAEALRRLAHENARLYAAEQMARVRAERATERAARRSALTAALAHALTPAEIAERTVTQGATALGAYAGVVVLCDAEGTLRTAAALGYPPAIVAVWPVVPTDAPVPVAVAARTRQPVWLSNRAMIAARYPALVSLIAPDTEAQAAIPLIVAGEVVGVIGLSFTTPQLFDADDQDLLIAMTEQCAQALDRARLFESLQRELAERRQIEATLRLHDRAIAASPSGILITDVTQPDNPTIYCNPAFTTLTGYAAHEVLGHNCRFLQGPDTDPAVIAAMREALASGESIQRTLRNYRRDGTPFWNDLAIAPVRDEAGRLTHFVGIQTDVTARVEAMEALRASEERFARAFAASPIALSISTLDEGRILEVNTGFAELSGHTPAELVGRSVYDLTIWSQPTDRARLARALADKPTIRDVEIRFRTSTGATRIGLVAAATIDLHGERCLLAQIQDITAWKAAETALRASEARFRSLAQSSPDCLYVVDLVTQNLIYCNREEFLGYPMALLRQPGRLFAGVHEDDRPVVLAHWGTLITAPDDGTHVVEYRMRRADGAWEWLQNRGTVLERGAAGAPTQLMVSISTITARKQAEEQRRALDRALLETQKLESLGVLAGGIAHDFNNMLVAMLGNAELALLDLPESHPATPSVTQVQVAARRAAELTGQLLAYSGRGRFVVGPLDLGQLVHEMGTLLRASVPRIVTLEYALSPGLPPVEGDATQLRQVVMNLVINAAEAIGSAGGAVQVRVEPRMVDAAFLATCAFGANATPGAYLALEVTDTGSGMDQATMGRIFEPFFTTKFTGRGLGMAAVQGIVRAHTGAIQLQSTPGQGTTITVLLPPSAGAVQPPLAPAAREMDALPTGGTLLVIDDEPEVRAVTARILSRLGYGVRVAAGGEAGIAVLAAEPEIAGVLLDLTMPGLSGEETLQRLRALGLALPVVVVSGYSEQEVRSRIGAAGRVGVLQKPFTPQALREAVRQALSSEGT